MTYNSKVNKNNEESSGKKERHDSQSDLKNNKESAKDTPSISLVDGNKTTKSNT